MHTLDKILRNPHRLICTAQTTYYSKNMSCRVTALLYHSDGVTFLKVEGPFHMGSRPNVELGPTIYLSTQSQPKILGPGHNVPLR